MSRFAHDRLCTDCNHRWTFDVAGVWLDPCICPACGSDESIGVPVSIEDELAALEGRAV